MTRPRFVRLAVVIAGCVALVGAGTAMPAKKVSAEKYAKTVCTTIDGLSEARNALVDRYNALAGDDLATLQAQSIALADEFLTKLDRAKQRFKKTTPDIDDATKVRKLFVAFVTDATGEIRSAVDTFRAADPNGVAFVGDVISFETAFNVLEAKLGDPFSKIKDQELLGAFDEEKSCQEVVQVFG